MKEIEPIAYFRSPLKEKFGIPRQSGVVAELRGHIVFEPQFSAEEALRGLDGFDYLWLIWGFHRAVRSNGREDFRPTVRPPRLGGNARLGVFATRSPFRPNGLGLSSVRIRKILKGKIEVLGADLMDGTPIYDIKPYVPYVDAHPEARGGFTESEWKPLEVVIPNELSAQLSPEEQAALRGILAQDPRPHYQDDATRVYGMDFGSHNVQFRVSDGVVEVVGL